LKSLDKTNNRVTKLQRPDEVSILLRRSRGHFAEMLNKKIITHTAEAQDVVE
jgi:hypothetical protein